MESTESGRLSNMLSDIKTKEDEVIKRMELPLKILAEMCHADKFDLHLIRICIEDIEMNLKS